MEHYVCKGTCGGVANEPGVCQAEQCPRYHAPLEKCECQDDKHEAVRAEAERMNGGEYHT